MYTRGCQNVVICFDASDESTNYERVKKTIDFYLKTIPFVLICFNKCDLFSENEEMRLNLKKIKKEIKNDFPQFSIVQCSAKNSQNVNQIFTKVARKLIFEHQGIEIPDLNEKWIPYNKKSMKFWKKDLYLFLVYFFILRKNSNSFCFNLPKPIVIKIIVEVSDLIYKGKYLKENQCDFDVVLDVSLSQNFKTLDYKLTRCD